MKTFAIFLVLGSILLFGCAQQQPAPTATPTKAATPTIQATAAPTTVDTSAEEQELGDAGDELSELENLTADLDAAELDVSDEEMEALG